MTVSASTGKAGPFPGNGVATSFAFDFKVLAKGDLRAVLAAVSTGAETTLTLDSDYSVTLNADQDTNPGGTVTYPLSGSPMTSANTLTIVADLEISQPTDITNAGGFYPNVIENALDRIVMLVRQVYESVTRSLKLAVSTPDGVSADLPVPVANQVLGWNSDGTGFQNYAPVDNTLLSAALAAPSGAGEIGVTGGGTVQSTFDQFVYVSSYSSGYTDQQAIAAADAVAVTRGAALVLANKTYSTTSDFTISAPMVVFDGAILQPAIGSTVTIVGKIIAPDVKIFEVGKMVTALNCAGPSTTLTTLKFWFDASDVGKQIWLKYGGAANTSAIRTISARASAQSVTLDTAPDQAISTGTSINVSYALDNQGQGIIGGGWVTCANTVGSINPAWWGALSGAANVAATTKAICNTYFAYSAQYGGAEIFHPPGEFYIDKTPCIDVNGVITTGHRWRTTYYRADAVTNETMTNLVSSWQGRYGDTGVNDWSEVVGCKIGPLKFDGNKANQTAITPGTGSDSYDSCVDLLHFRQGLIDGAMAVNGLRFAFVFSTNCDDSKMHDVWAYDCDEGGCYAEVSKNIEVISPHLYNCNASGWEQGAISFNDINGGTIDGGTLEGPYNGVYIRQSCEGISVNGTTVNTAGRYGFWVKDENASGSGAATSPKNITFNGVISKNAATQGLRTEHCKNISANGGAITGSGQYNIYVYQCDDFSASNVIANGAGTTDIVIDAGTTDINLNMNQGNVELIGTSTTRMSVKVPVGYTFTNSATGTGYLLIEKEANNGDGVSRPYFGTPFASDIAAWPSYADDAAAATAGVAVGQFYRNGSVVQIRAA